MEVLKEVAITYRVRIDGVEVILAHNLDSNSVSINAYAGINMTVNSEGATNSNPGVLTEICSQLESKAIELINNNKTV